MPNEFSYSIGQRLSSFGKPVQPKVSILILQSLMSVALLSSFLCACPAAERVPPPDDLDGLLRYVWNEFGNASDAELMEAGANAAAILQDLLAEEDAKVGALETLGLSDLATFELDDGRDPTQAPGFFLASRFRCDLDVLADVLTHPNQGGVHPGVYDSYKRDYAVSRDEWLAAEFGLLSWSVEYEATPTATQYLARTKSAIRRFDANGPIDGIRTLIQRTYLAEPAIFSGNPDNHIFDQDYQVEMFMQTAEGEVVHLYGLWRHMQLGLVGINDDVFVDFQINGLVEWDQQTEAACATWPEFPAQ